MRYRFYTKARDGADLREYDAAEVAEVPGICGE